MSIDTCSFECKRATTHQLELLENDEKSLDRLQNRLKAVILSCFSEKKAARNPFVIENKISKVSTNTENQSERAVVKYAIPKKHITALDLNTNPDTPYTYYDLIDEGGYCESDGYMYTDIDRIKKHFSGEKSQKMLRTIGRFSKRTFS